MLQLLEGLLLALVPVVSERRIVAVPFPRLTYEESMARFGNDKPDLRFGMEIVELTDLVPGSEFSVFVETAATGGKVRGLNAKGAAARFSRKGLDELKGMLQVGDPGRAGALAQLLYGRSVRHGEFEVLEAGPRDVRLRNMGGAVVFSASTDLPGWAGLDPNSTTSINSLDFDLDGIAARLVYVGPAHTVGDVIVHLPEQRIVFTGDILFRLCTPIGWEGTFARWMQGEGFGSVRECERYRQQVVEDTAYERDHNEELSDPYDYKIELFSHAECVSAQDSRLR